MLEGMICIIKLDGSYVSWKEPDYKSLYLSKELCPGRAVLRILEPNRSGALFPTQIAALPSGEHCTPEHPILDYDQDLPGNAMVPF